MRFLWLATAVSARYKVERPTSGCAQHARLHGRYLAFHGQHAGEKAIVRGAGRQLHRGVSWPQAPHAFVPNQFAFEVGE